MNTIQDTHAIFELIIELVDDTVLKKMIELIKLNVDPRIIARHTGVPMILVYNMIIYLDANDGEFPLQLDRTTRRIKHWLKPDADIHELLHVNLYNNS